MDAMTPRQRFLAAIACEPVDRPPVWLMRQAGRYLPEYRELRARHAFLDCVHDPELAAELTLQPLRRFPLDVAIVFSDILVVLEAMGLDVQFPAGGPRVTPALDGGDPDRLQPVDAGRAFEFLAQALRLLRRALDGEAGLGAPRALMGFAGAPWTLACYAVEGSGSKDFASTRALPYRDAGRTRELLSRLAAVVADLLVVQLRAGADAVQLFDTWGGMLPADVYERHVLPHVARIVERVHAEGGRVVVFVKDGEHLLDQVLSTGADVVGLDWRADIGAAAARCAGRAAVQGNVDPALLFGREEALREGVRRCLGAVRGRTGHVLNLGHGCMPGTPVDGVAALVDEVVASGRRGDAS